MYELFDIDDTACFKQIPFLYLPLVGYLYQAPPLISVLQGVHGEAVCPTQTRQVHLVLRRVECKFPGRRNRYWKLIIAVAYCSYQELQFCGQEVLCHRLSCNSYFLFLTSFNWHLPVVKLRLRMVDIIGAIIF